MEKKTCNHIGLFTENPGRLVDFYVHRLGFEPGEKRTISAEIMRPVFGLDADCAMTKLHYGNVTLEVFALGEVPVESRGRPAAGLNHWGLNVQDKAFFCDAAESRGARVLRIPYGDRTIFFIEDPEGNLIEIFDK